MSVWWWLCIASGGCFALKIAGFGLPSGSGSSALTHRLVNNVPVALLAGLIALQTATSGSHVVVDARVGGLAVAGVLVWRRAPFLVVIIAAAAVTALIRAVA